MYNYYSKMLTLNLNPVHRRPCHEEHITAYAEHYKKIDYDFSRESGVKLSEMKLKGKTWPCKCNK